jgi:hypothetical protein
MTPLYYLDSYRVAEIISTSAVKAADGVPQDLLSGYGVTAVTWPTPHGKCLKSA